jgi:hypothetical protein
MDAGAETSASFMQNLVLCFLTYPKCLKKAQEEIDTVIGPSRMPTLDDYDNLPYLRALVDEVRSNTCYISPLITERSSTPYPASPFPTPDAVRITPHGNGRCSSE